MMHLLRRTEPESKTLKLPESYGPDYTLEGTVLGTDLAKHRDKTQVVTLLRIWNHKTELEHGLIVDCVPMVRMDYESQARRLLHMALDERLPDPIIIAFDRGNAGTAFYEMLLRELRQVDRGGIQLVPLQLVNTLEPHKGPDGRTIMLSHNDLLTAGQIAMESDRYRLVRSLNAYNLRDEMANLRVSMTPSGVTHIEGGGGRHDDAAFAALYALWYPTWRPRPTSPGIWGGASR